MMSSIKMVNLWNGNAPTHSGLSGDEIVRPEDVLEVTNITDATLTIYSPDNTINTGIATIICPGGAYAGLAITMQGYDYAAWLSSVGITGIVLKYRMPNKRKEIPLDDVQAAIRYTRAHATALGIKENKIGVTGFSAGGHLAASSSTLFSEEGISTRPDFSILFYPVITMGADTNETTRLNLLGDHPSLSDIERYSCEKQVRSNTPPALILASDDDSIVAPVNSTMYYNAMKQYNIPASLYIFPQGDHAWGIKGSNMFGENFQYVEQAKDLILKWIMK